mmetsp:Transcript_29060/g.67376  ORF Transcript_29060/g.67376 Transcript_29060/m.67376 type:complete len:879 (-) Transcript_29060:138-2774(-)
MMRLIQRNKVHSEEALKADATREPKAEPVEQPWYAANHIFWYLGVESEIDYWSFHVVGSGVLCLLVAGVLVALEDLSFVNALFSAVSAFCVTGLSTVDISEWHAPAQFVYLLTFVLGSGYMGCVVLLFLRRSHTLRSIRETKAKVGPVYDHHVFERDCLNRLVVCVCGSGVILMALGFLVLGSYMQATGKVEHPWWWAFFHASSAWSNAGISISPASLTNFKTDWGVLIPLGILITLGHTGAPMMFRALLVFGERFSSDGELYEHLILESHVYCSYLYGRVLTKIVMIYSFLVSLICFCIILGNEWNAPVFADLNAGEKLLAAWFTTISARFAGFTVVPIHELHLSSIMALMTAMYLPSSPVVDSTMPETHPDVGIEAVFNQHSRRMLSRWTSHLVLALLILTIIEENRDSFMLFHLTFETVSAFGTVGFSLGSPSAGAGPERVSYSHALRSSSKVIIMFLMILGKHRDLKALTNQFRQVELRGPDWPLKLNLPVDALTNAMRPALEAARKAPGSVGPNQKKSVIHSLRADDGRPRAQSLVPHALATASFVLSHPREKTVKPLEQAVPPPVHHTPVSSFFAGDTPDEAGLPPRRMSIAHVANSVRRLSVALSTTSVSSVGSSRGGSPHHNTPASRRRHARGRDHHHAGILSASPREGFFAGRRSSTASILVGSGERSSPIPVASVSGERESPDYDASSGGGTPLGMSPPLIMAAPTPLDSPPRSTRFSPERGSPQISYNEPRSPPTQADSEVSRRNSLSLSPLPALPSSALSSSSPAAPREAGWAHQHTVRPRSPTWAPRSLRESIDGPPPPRVVSVGEASVWAAPAEQAQSFPDPTNRTRSAHSAHNAQLPLLSPPPPRSSLVGPNGLHAQNSLGGH